MLGFKRNGGLKMNEITPKEVEKKLNTNEPIHLIDVREVDEVKAGKNSRSIFIYHWGCWSSVCMNWIKGLLIRWYAVQVDEVEEPHNCLIVMAIK